MEMSFKLTYATMFNPPAQMHERFEAAAASTRAGVGAQHALFIDGKDVLARNNFIKTTPVDGSPLGRFPAADAADVDAGVMPNPDHAHSTPLQAASAPGDRARRGNFRALGVEARIAQRTAVRADRASH
jgi:1-pyrroline-5-carboxylate dehydrogenase